MNRIITIGREFGSGGREVGRRLAESKRFVDIVTRMREECETDAREKFEVGAIPTQLAGLWMSKYGYTTKQEAGVEVKPSEKLSDILSQLGGDDLDST